MSRARAASARAGLVTSGRHSMTGTTPGGTSGSPPNNAMFVADRK
jgi:hypothetical protein